ncbi:MAG TPA: recombination mediator RecR [Acidobacteriota bacterium]|nr:recombination mediator RecR [Acidobacteriota bacterium]
MDPRRDPVQNLIEELKKLPGIGSKTAQRLTFFLIRQPRETAQRLADALIRLKDDLVLCSLCHNIAGSDPCRFCSDPNRDASTICVVEEPFNIVSIEASGYHGRYHVLHGAIKPLEGIGPEELKVRSLLERLRDDEVKEIIIATNATSDGEATALYLNKLIKPLGVRVTRIAQGIPVGSDLEFADQVTISRAFSGRREM